MLHLVRALLRHARYLKAIGLGGYFRYMTTAGGKPVTVSIGDKTIVVRRRTPDLPVAISCLSGEFDILSRLFDRDYRGVVIDAGGYIGTAAIAFAEMYPKSTVVTIEPASANLQILKQNVNRYPNIRIVQGALVSRRNTNILLKDPGQGAWGLTVVSGRADFSGSELVERVEGYDLAGLGVDLDDVGILKLDIEGAEKDLFDHQRDRLSRITAIFAELHDRYVPGCSESFRECSKDRWILKSGGEKYLSIRKG